MALQIGDTAPDFEAETTEGTIKFHDWIGDSWAVLFSHPKDFTPVCTTELGYMANIKPEFDKRNTKIIGLSVDPSDKHSDWAKDIEETQGTAPNYPIIADSDYAVSKAYGMLPADTSGDAGDRRRRTTRRFATSSRRPGQEDQADPRVPDDDRAQLRRGDPRDRLSAADERAQGRDSGELEAGRGLIIAGSVSNDDAKEIFGEWESPKPYIRIVPDPATSLNRDDRDRPGRLLLIGPVAVLVVVVHGRPDPLEIGVGRFDHPRGGGLRSRPIWISTAGSACRLCSQAGARSAPPLEGTTR